MLSFRTNTEEHKLKQQDAIFHPLDYKELVSLMSPSVAVNLWKWKLSSAGCRVNWPYHRSSPVTT